MESHLRNARELVSSYIPEDHETLPHIVLPVLFHALVLTYLYFNRRSDGSVLAVALFSLSQALFSSAPTTFCPFIFAPRHFTKEQQMSWSMTFFALPALGTSLVALVFLLLIIWHSLDSLAKARGLAIQKKLERDGGGDASTAAAESKKDI